MKVTIYSDGGSDPNPGIGGWAAILRYGQHEKILTGNDPNATNNRMELQAAIEALRALNRPSEVDFYTDSEYVRRGITEWIEKWAAKDWMRGRKAVPNRELWQALWRETKRHQIEWHWVKGHTGNRLNERVDALARQARAGNHAGNGSRARHTPAFRARVMQGQSRPRRLGNCPGTAR